MNTNSMKYRDALYEVDTVTDIRHLMNYSAEQYGDNPAYLVKDKPGGTYHPISFRESRSNITAFGTALLDLGLKDKFIAVTGENRYEWVLTYMATVCGVGVIVPIDRELSKEEIANLLNRSNAAAIVYSGKMEKLATEAIGCAERKDIISISMDATESTDARLSMKALIAEGRRLIEEGRREYFRMEIDPDALCSLIFTSGTTGLAKGVMLSHTNIVHNVISMAQFMQVPGWRALNVLPLHHTYEFNCGILGTMFQGVTVGFCEGLKYIVKNMAEVKANIILGVPLMFEKMYKMIWRQAESSGKAKVMRRALSVSKAVGGSKLKTTKRVFKAVHQAMGGDMRLIIAGGAAIDPSVIEDFNAMGFIMVQGYGMTECAPIVAVNKDRCHKAASVGLPLGKTEIKVVDADEDGIGEIIYRGPSVMLGYYNDPEETAKVLREGWLYSGDYGYIDEDGFVYLTGRKKNVIVTKNGKNIFPEEVEYYLLKSDYIEEVVVWGKDEDAGDTIICADIFPSMALIRENYGNISDAEIRKIIDEAIDEANEKMPSYKRVKRFDLVDEEFEKTTTQKIMRHKVTHQI